jgi:thiol-disulfide isomerase/thioredoxin
MSEGPERKAKPGPLAWALGGVALAGVAAAVYIIGQASTNPAPPAPVVHTGPAPSKPFSDKVSRPAQPTPAPDYTFYDAGGKAMKVADLKGKVVIVNLWATWCGPCKVEMPTLAKMAASYAGKGVEVVPISIDGPEDAQKATLFIAQNAPLKFYLDREAKLPFQLKPPAEGMPTTVIYGKDGLEQARVSGDVDWTSPEAHALIDKALAG